MIIAIKKLLAGTFIFTIFGTISGSTAWAQAIPQDPVSKAAVDVQRQAAAGRIPSKEASQIEGKLWQLKSEEQQDMARHGGYLTPQDNERLWSQIHSIEGGNSFDGNNWHSSPRHSGILHNGYNPAYGAQNNEAYSNYNAGGPGYNGYNNGYNSGYSNGYNPGYNNGNQNGYNNSSSGGSKFSQAAGILQNLLHH